MASGLFRFMAGLGRNIIVANTAGSCALLTVFVMGGFILSRGSAIKFFLYLQPFLVCVYKVYIYIYVLKLPIGVRWYQEVVDLGLLVLTNDVCSECYLCQ